MASTTGGGPALIVFRVRLAGAPSGGFGGDCDAERISGCPTAVLDLPDDTLRAAAGGSNSTSAAASASATAAVAVALARARVAAALAEGGTVPWLEAALVPPVSKGKAQLVALRALRKASPTMFLVCWWVWAA
jgi:hypothetical protein